VTADDIHDLRLAVVRGQLNPTELLEKVCDLQEYVVTSTGMFHHVDDRGLPACGVRTFYVRCWADLVRSYRVCRNCDQIRRWSR
jgi:hypothetical protein